MRLSGELAKLSPVFQIGITISILLVVGCRDQPGAMSENDATLSSHRKTTDEFDEESRNPSGRPTLRSQQLALFQYYDTHYDSEVTMLKVPCRSPGYHTKLENGVPVHPTRESLIYALALLQRNAAGDSARSAAIINRVTALQDQEPTSDDYGTWPWFLEEPLAEMASPDLNWADFCGASLAQILVLHGDQLTLEASTNAKRALRHAAARIQIRDVKRDYTNIAVLGGGVCAAAGEILDDVALLSYGRRRIQSVAEVTQEVDGFPEYNSPPYTKVIIAECERILAIVDDAETQRAAKAVVHLAWKQVAESFHFPTQQWAGPIARTSRLRLRNSMAAFLSERLPVTINVHPSMQQGEPRGYAVVPPQPCPADLLASFQFSPSAPTKKMRVFRQAAGNRVATVGVTWMDDVACLGSINQSTFWTQRKPVLGFWKTESDPAVAFRVRFLKDGRDFASMGLRTAQNGSSVLLRLESITGAGDWHPSLDRPDDGKFRVKDLRLRFELSGQGVSVSRIKEHQFCLKAGAHQVVIHATQSDFVDNDVSWQSGQSNDRACLDAICYSGKETVFDFRQQLPMRILAGIQLIPIGNQPVGEPPGWKDADGQSMVAEWNVGKDHLLSLP